MSSCVYELVCVCCVRGRSARSTERGAPSSADLSAPATKRNETTEIALGAPGPVPSLAPTKATASAGALPRVPSPHHYSSLDLGLYAFIFSEIFLFHIPDKGQKYSHIF